MKPKPFRPMKACSSDGEDRSQLRFPLYGTPKLDGIRAVVTKQGVMSSKMKLIPNRYIQELLHIPAFHGFDGELRIDGTFQDVSSGIMSREGEPKFTFYVFDLVDPESNYLERTSQFEEWAGAWQRSRCQFLTPIKLNNLDDLEWFIDICIDSGFEGAVVRRGDSPYKYGRSTWTEQYAIKFKPFADAEARIIGFEEQKENTNVAKVNELGLSKRSSHKAGKVGKGTLGKFLVRSKQWGDFKIGTGLGLSNALRDQIWANQKKYLGKLIKFKYQLEGTMDKPRIPVFLGFRDKRDL